MTRFAVTRREALLAGVAASVAWSRTIDVFGDNTSRQFKIAACDWSIGQRGKLEAFEVAKQLGLDGLQISFSEPGVPNDLRQEHAREEYQQAAKDTKVEIASLAMGVLNERPYASDPDTEQWVEQCIEIMPKLKQKIVLLAFFGQGDIRNKPELQEEVIRRLKKVAPKAEAAGVILGIESWLNVEDHVRILDAVGSKAVQVYYDTANMEKMGYDIYREMRQLGRDRICELHCKENGSVLGEGRIDFPRVKETLGEIGYEGWLVIESSVGEGKSMLDSYRHNVQYLRKLFS